jgi:hypothetical protein
VWGGGGLVLEVLWGWSYGSDGGESGVG